MLTPYGTEQAKAYGASLGVNPVWQQASQSIRSQFRCERFMNLFPSQTLAAGFVLPASLTSLAPYPFCRPLPLRILTVMVPCPRRHSHCHCAVPTQTFSLSLYHAHPDILTLIVPCPPRHSHSHSAMPAQTFTVYYQDDDGTGHRRSQLILVPSLVTFGLVMLAVLFIILTRRA